MTLTLVQGDTAPTLRGTITDDDTGDPLNLTGCTVVFQMRKVNDQRYTINASCTVTSPSTGQVEYSLGNNDLNTPGDYICQYQVTYADSRIQTTVNAEAITIRRQ